MKVADYEIERAGYEKLASASGMARKSSEDRSGLYAGKICMSIRFWRANEGWR